MAFVFHALLIDKTTSSRLIFISQRQQIILLQPATITLQNIHTISQECSVIYQKKTLFGIKNHPNQSKKTRFAKLKKVFKQEYCLEFLLEIAADFYTAMPVIGEYEFFQVFLCWKLFSNSRSTRGKSLLELCVTTFLPD